MIPALRAAYLVALSVWVGTLVFFSVAAAPAVFATLPRDEAARAVAAIFPAYYGIGWLAGGVALAATLALAVRTGSLSTAARWRVGLLTVMLALSLYAGAVVLPEVRAARLAGDQAAQRSGHRTSVLLNVIVAAAGLTLTILTSNEDRNRSTTRRSGIVLDDDRV